MRFNKNLIFPIVAAFALILKKATGTELNAVETDTLVDGILALVTGAGIFMKPKK